LQCKLWLSEGGLLVQLDEVHRDELAVLSVLACSYDILLVRLEIFGAAKQNLERKCFSLRQGIVLGDAGQQLPKLLVFPDGQLEVEQEVPGMAVPFLVASAQFPLFRRWLIRSTKNWRPAYLVAETPFFRVSAILAHVCLEERIVKYVQSNNNVIALHQRLNK
jgi:hypothetical protein